MKQRIIGPHAERKAGDRGSGYRPRWAFDHCGWTLDKELSAAFDHRLPEQFAHLPWQRLYRGLRVADEQVAAGAP